MITNIKIVKTDASFFKLTRFHDFINIKKNKN